MTPVELKLHRRWVHELREKLIDNYGYMLERLTEDYGGAPDIKAIGADLAQYREALETLIRESGRSS